MRKCLSTSDSRSAITDAQDIAFAPRGLQASVRPAALKAEFSDAAAQSRIGQPIHRRCALLQVVSGRSETDKYLYLRIKPEGVSPFHHLTVLAETRFLAQSKLHRIRGFKLPVAYPKIAKQRNSS